MNTSTDAISRASISGDPGERGGPDEAGGPDTLQTFPEQAHEAGPGPRASRSSLSGSRFSRLIARFGLFGFLFFLVKGLLWLAVPALVIAWRGS